MIVGTTIGGLKPKTKLTGEELIPFEQESENGSISTNVLKEFVKKDITIPPTEDGDTNFFKVHHRV